MPVHDLVLLAERRFARRSACAPVDTAAQAELRAAVHDGVARCGSPVSRPRSHTLQNEYMCVYTHTHTHICIYMCVCVYTCVCIHTHTQHTHICIYMCVCVYTHTHTFRSGSPVSWPRSHRLQNEVGVLRQGWPDAARRPTGLGLLVWQPARAVARAHGVAQVCRGCRRGCNIRGAKLKRAVCARPSIYAALSAEVVGYAGACTRAMAE